MKKFNIIFAIARQNIRKWSSNYRVLMIAVILMIFIHSYTKDISGFAYGLGIKMSAWIFPFLYTERYMKLLFFFPIILLFCDAPFIDNNQPYIILRSKRTAWSIGQILYIFLANIIYFAFLIIATIGINIRNITFENDWGKVFGTLATTDAHNLLNTPLKINSGIIKYFTPLQALWFTFLLSCLSGVILGLVIYACNSIFKNRFCGITVSSALLILSAVLQRQPDLQWFSPMSWNTLNNIDIGNTTALPSFQYIILADVFIIAVLSVVSVIANKKQEIYVLAQVQ